MADVARRWQTRLGELIAEYEVPGATLAFLHEGEVHEFAAGVLNVATGVEATPDSLFQIGSITKLWTSTQVMLLVEQGRVTLDTPVREILPEFKVADPEVTKTVTLRHLLSHTSGIDGDLFLDTGRGDDCLEKYVEACADLAQNHPLGATQSYCNSGFSVLGRAVERLTGKVWDAALREQVVEDQAQDQVDRAVLVGPADQVQVAPRGGLQIPRHHDVSVRPVPARTASRARSSCCPPPGLPPSHSVLSCSSRSTKASTGIPGQVASASFSRSSPNISRPLGPPNASVMPSLYSRHTSPGARSSVTGHRLIFFSAPRMEPRTATSSTVPSRRRTSGAGCPATARSTST